MKCQKVDKVLKSEQKKEVFKGGQETAVERTSGQNLYHLSNNRNNVVLNYNPRYK